MSSQHDSSDLKKTKKVLSKMFHKVNQSVKNEGFLHFESLNTVDKVQIQLDDFGDIQRAIFNHVRTNTFEPILFSIKDSATNSILFKAQVQSGHGFIIQKLTLTGQEEKIMTFTLPNISMKGPNNVERTVGKLQTATDVTLYKIGQILGPTEQYIAHDVISNSSDIRVKESNPFYVSLCRCCLNFYTNFFTLEQNEETLGKLFPGIEGSETIMTVQYLNKPPEQTRATILGIALYFVALGLPELLRLLDATLPQSSARNIEV